MKIGQLPAEDLIRAVYFQIVVEAAAAKMIVSIPFLAWPGINGLFRYSFERFAGVFYTEQTRYFRFEMIDGRTEDEASAVEVAEAEVRASVALADEKGVQDAVVKLREAARALIQFESDPT